MLEPTCSLELSLFFPLETFRLSIYLGCWRAYVVPVVSMDICIHTSCSVHWHGIALSTTITLYSLCNFFFSPVYFLRPSFSLPLLVDTQLRGHIAGSFPPFPTTVRALHFLSREDFSSFLPSSIRVEFCLPTPGALSS